MIELYDRISDVSWRYDGLMARDEMAASDKYRVLTVEPCVLYKGEDGTTYGFETLRDLASRYAVPSSNMSEEAVLESVLKCMDGTYLAPGADVAKIQLDALNGSFGTGERMGVDTSVEVMRQIREAAKLAVRKASLTDEEALTVSTLYPGWDETAHYEADQIVRFDGALYRCEQAHDAQADWTPPAAPSLWSRIDIAEDGVDVWTQPTGAHNAYNTGDRVHYPTASDPIYVSTIDGNVWAPDAYPQGWELAQ